MQQMDRIAVRMRQRYELGSPIEVARAMRISRSSLYRLLKSGSLPSMRIGGLRRIRWTDVDAFLDNLTDES